MLSTSLLAQSSPNLSYGAVPTPGQWNSYFAAKQDALGYAPLNKAGDTLTGKLNAMPSTSTMAGLNIGQGQPPSNLVNGDVWITASGLFIYVNNQILGPYVSSLPSLSGMGGTLSCSQMPALTGDVTSSSGLCATNLATVNATAGSFGGSGYAVSLTVDGKGRITAISSSAISISYTQVGGLGTAATANVGTSGANVGLLNGNNTYSGSNSHTGSEAFTNTTTVPSTPVNDNSSKALNTGSLMAQLATIPAATVIPATITGNLPTAISGSSTTAAVTISAGFATNSGATAYITGAGYSWAVSNGNAINGYQGGTTLPNSSTIHFFLCTGTSGTGSFASTSLTPTLPIGYSTSYRRIFSLNTNASGVLISGTAVETQGGALLFYYTTQILDIAGTGTGTSSRSLFTLTVPAGIRVQPLYRANSDNSGAGSLLFTSGDETDVAPPGSNAPWTSAPGLDIDATTSNLNIGGTSAQVGVLTTNASGQIGARSFAGQAVNLYWVTRGWIDWRRS